MLGGAFCMFGGAFYVLCEAWLSMFRVGLSCVLGDAF